MTRGLKMTSRSLKSFSSGRPYGWYCCESLLKHYLYPLAVRYKHPISWKSITSAAYAKSPRIVFFHTLSNVYNLTVSTFLWSFKYMYNKSKKKKKKSAIVLTKF